jgi:hypothetical protein
MVKYSSLKKAENNSTHYENLGRGLTDRFKSGMEYVKNSRVGKTAGHIRDEIGYSIATDKVALKNPETRKWWLAHKILKYAPEIATSAYLIGYAIADNHYYSFPHLADLAKEGLTTKGSWTQPDPNHIAKPVEHSLNILLKPWCTTSPPLTNSFGQYEWNSSNTRPLYPIIEDRIGGGAVGLIPDAVYRGAQAIRKGVKHFKNKKP